MKKVFALILVICLMIPFAACGQNEKSKIKIGIAAPDVTHGWVAGVTYYAEKYCKEQGITYKIVTASDAAEMVAGLDDLVSWGASAIVTFPQWEGMASAIGEIVANGTPVVSFDKDIAVEGIYEVTGDNYGMGYECAKYIVSRAGSGATIAVMDVPASGSVCGLRKKGFYAYLAEINYDQSNIFEVASANFTREDGLRDMSDVLLAHPSIDAVFSMDDETSIGCIQAIVEAGRTDIKAITGGGGMQEYFNMINDEKYAYLGLASALYSPIMIQDAIAKAVAISNGEKIDALVIVPTTLVTKENVAQHIDTANTIY